MRQIGTLQTQAEADRFTAFLVTQSISAVAEPDTDWWTVWVRDEDQVSRARDALEEFRRNPNNAHYHGVMREANAVLQAEAKRHNLARKRDPRGRRPLGTAQSPGHAFDRRGHRLVRGPVHAFRLRPGQQQRHDSLADVLQRPPRPAGQLGSGPDSGPADRHSPRPVVAAGDPDLPARQRPALAVQHDHVPHLCAGRSRAQGAARLGLLILLIALPSNAAQGLAPSTWGTLSGGPFFLGMSGVVYGLMGYLWMKTVYNSGLGIVCRAGTVVFLLGWMTIGFTGVLQSTLPMANLAHAGGLLAGMIVGYVSSPRT